MQKPEGLFSIGEISAACGVSSDTLRFYETKALITPAYTDPESGYRYYNLKNLLRLRTVLGLKDIGMSLVEIKDYLDGERNLHHKLAELRERRELLERAIENLQIRGVRAGDLTVYEIKLPERCCLCRRIQASDVDHALIAIGEFYDELIRDGIVISRSWPEFCEYPDERLLQGELSLTDFTVIACLPVEKNNAPPETVLYPAANAVAVNYRGDFYGLSKAYIALGRYMEQYGYIPTGPPQEIYLENEAVSSLDLAASGNITRVIIPIQTN